jgi:hypothetical protein
MRHVEPKSYPDAPLVTLGAGRLDVHPLVVRRVPRHDQPTLGSEMTVVEYEFSATEREAIKTGGRVRLMIFQCGHPFAPISADVIPKEGTETVEIQANAGCFWWPKGRPITYAEVLELAGFDPARVLSVLWSAEIEGHPARVHGTLTPGTDIVVALKTRFEVADTSHA